MLGLVPLFGLGVLHAQTSPQRSPFEAVPEPRQSSPPKASGPIIEAIAFRGGKGLPQSTLRAIIASRVGDMCDMETLRRDSQALYKTGRFSEVSWEIEPGSAGAIVRFLVVERPVIQAIEIEGDSVVTVAEILERLTDADWSREGTHTEIGRYTTETWLEIYAEHAHQHARQITAARASALQA